jgi:hypothetical protein
MKQYLLSVCYPPDGKQPSPEALEKITREVRLGRRDEAADAYDRAIARSENAKERELLLGRRRGLEEP